MMRKRCAYCAMEGKENRAFVICLVCNILLCLVKERNCSQKHHIYIYIYIFIYILYIFSLKCCGFLFGFYIFPPPYWVCIYIIFYIYIVIFNILCFECPNVVKEMQLELVKIIPTNQLMLYLICHFS